MEQETRTEQEQDGAPGAQPLDQAEGAAPQGEGAESALAKGDIEAAVKALDLDPPDDVQETGAVKKHLAGVLLRRVAKQLMEAR